MYRRRKTACLGKFHLDRTDQEPDVLRLYLHREDFAWTLLKRIQRLATAGLVQPPLEIYWPFKLTSRFEK